MKKLFLLQLKKLYYNNPFFMFNELIKARKKYNFVYFKNNKVIDRLKDIDLLIKETKKYIKKMDKKTQKLYISVL